MLNVFITVDTELWPQHADWRATGLRDDYERDIIGKTSRGDFGVQYQIDVLNRHGLKAVFFVEALFASTAGPDRLCELVHLIQNAGHEVQLHVHSEWLAWMEPSLLPGRTGQNCADFTLDEQAKLLEEARNNLVSCGARQVCAFRAGNYGANLDTLRALARCQISYDTSYNYCYLGTDCAVHTPAPLLQPAVVEGIHEFPITYFQDRPGHYRHAQLCACSSQEMEHALMAAWSRDWYSFVIVSHSFELLKGRKTRGKPVVPDRIVVRRFERLCRFLDTHRDRFRTAGFADIDPTTIPQQDGLVPLQSRLHRTAWRLAEQAARRVF